MDEKLIDRVKKLLALGESDNEHEAALALSKAQELMAAHNITLGRLRLSEVGEVKVQSKTGVTKVKPYEMDLMRLVSRAFGCRLFVKKGYGRVTMVWTFVGPKHQLPMAEWTAEVLMKRLAKARARWVAERSIGTRDRFLSKQADAFCVGWVYNVSKKVYDLSGSGEWAAAIEEYIKIEVKPSDKDAKAQDIELDPAAFHDGMRASKDESLHRPMEQNPQQRKLGHG